MKYVASGPMVTLNRIAARAMVEGPHAALAELTLAGEDKVLDAHCRADAVQAHLLDMLGKHARACRYFAIAAQRTLGLPEQRYLAGRARLDPD